jgi:hypothetical protein
MVDLRAGAYHRFLDLDEVSDPDPSIEARARAKYCKLADHTPFRDIGAFDVAEGFDGDIVRDPDAWAEENVGLDKHVLARNGICGESHPLRRNERRATGHRLEAQPPLQDLLDFGELGARVDSAHFVLFANLIADALA